LGRRVSGRPPTVVDCAGRDLAGGRRSCLRCSVTANTLPRWNIERSRVYPFLYLLPAIALFGVFLLYPILYTFRLSFLNWDGFLPIAQAQFVGLRNYVALLDTKAFLLALRNTIWLVVGGAVLQMSLGFVLAFSLFYFVGKRASAVLRTWYFAPCVLSFVMVAITWTKILEYGGSVNQMLEMVGLGALARPWLSQPSLLMWIIVWVDSWQWAGYNVILYFSALMAVPGDIVEAAKIDGADALQTARFVVLPLLRRASAVLLVLNVIGGFQVFDTVYVMTGGGPAHLSEVLTTLMYYYAFRRVGGPRELGTASAIAVILVVVVFAFSFFRLRMSSKDY
jgi:raffinose/stachyose/melibiose transport system permease protein